MRYLSWEAKMITAMKEIQTASQDQTRHSILLIIGGSHPTLSLVEEIMKIRKTMESTRASQAVLGRKRKEETKIIG